MKRKIILEPLHKSNFPQFSISFSPISSRQYEPAIFKSATSLKVYAQYVKKNILRAWVGRVVRTIECLFVENNGVQVILQKMWHIAVNWEYITLGKLGLEEKGARLVLLFCNLRSPGGRYSGGLGPTSGFSWKIQRKSNNARDFTLLSVNTR